ncbi:MAG: phenylacetic acid degradation bifunctional protein PaaZ [Gammaproteobacteria bacterium]|nr:phenylacetic acid degradation bifunctional protein PaaZ [Gammaproteobacteria bacterium]MDH4253438.1 phenylacetic acid degradation bifunctional protein PaaZ [Gammaproteobacteria bacterium]MDH5309200.1 phenylacetic acid degradation bifunctional protein PaaZ [Gammaproteobacteria bacterium]
MELGSFACNQWVTGSGRGQTLRSAVDGAEIGTIDSSGLDFTAMHSFARDVGGPKLRRMTFHQRALLLKSLAQYLSERKEEFYELSTMTGATRADSWIDIDGGISTLFVYSGKGRRELPNAGLVLDGPPESLSRKGSFVGQHVWLPKHGVALHINAFNFPCWGMLEKLAPALLAGVPVIVKPASATAYLTERIVRRIIESGLLPEGALQLVCGGVGNLIDRLDCQDTIAFTGSKSTAEKLQVHPRLLAQSVRFTAETDSLNASILGPDAMPGTPEFDLFVAEVVREMTSKAGQKCTAIRRILAPASVTGDLGSALSKSLAELRIGNPARKDVQMGALASLGQREELRQRIAMLAAESSLLLDGGDDPHLLEADADKGAFVGPTLLVCERPLAATAVHSVEAFGPVATILPYESLDDAIELLRLGGGSLAGSIFTNDDAAARELVLGAAPWHGRMLIVNRHCGAESTGHGSPLPHLVHGGPGRAGGGEELGGIRGVLHYMQRTALQGSPETLAAVGGRWIRGANENRAAPHPFRKTFDELQLGDTFMSAERVVSMEDIEHFAEFTGDRFYAHTDEAAARKNPFFDGRVAHGYLIVSFAAGLFVDPEFGPVLANYGLDELRFAKPVNPGDALKVRLTCKQKTLREGSGYGEVRWDTEVTNQAGDIVAAYDVLTMVATSEQWQGMNG